MDEDIAYKEIIYCTSVTKFKNVRKYSKLDESGRSIWRAPPPPLEVIVDRSIKLENGFREEKR
jgi:hypothetical protein